MYIVLVLLCCSLNVFASTVERPHYIKTHFVEVLRACWRNRANVEFSKHLPKFDGLIKYEENAFIETVELSRTLCPLACLESHILSDFFFNFNGRVELKRVLKSASSLESLYAVLENSDYWTSSKYFTVAHAAALTDNWNVLEVFLDRYPHLINQKLLYRQETALHFAISYRSYNCVQILLERGADIYAKCYSGVTPVDLAIALGDDDILKLFVNKTDLLSRPGPGYECFRQASRLAMEWGLSGLAFSFATKGAISDLYHSITGMNLLHLACIKESPYLEDLKLIVPFEKDYSGLYPSHLAILYQNYDVLYRLSRDELMKPAPFKMNLLEFAAFRGAPRAVYFVSELLPELSVFDAASKMIEFDCVYGLDALLYVVNHTYRVQEYLNYALISCHAFKCANLLIAYFPYLFSTLTVLGLSVQEYAILKDDLVLVQFFQDLGLYRDFNLSNNLSPKQYAIVNAKIKLFHILNRS